MSSRKQLVMPKFRGGINVRAVFNKKTAPWESILGQTFTFVREHDKESNNGNVFRSYTKKTRNWAASCTVA